MDPFLFPRVRQSKNYKPVTVNSWQWVFCMKLPLWQYQEDGRLDNAQNYPARQCAWLYTSGIMIVVPSRSCIPECCHMSFLFLSEPVPPSSAHVWTVPGPPAGLQVPVSSTTVKHCPQRCCLKCRCEPVLSSFKIFQGMSYCHQEPVPSSEAFLEKWVPWDSLKKACAIYISAHSSWCGGPFPPQTHLY